MCYFLLWSRAVRPGTLPSPVTSRFSGTLGRSGAPVFRVPVGSFDYTLPEVAGEGVFDLAAGVANVGVELAKFLEK